VLLKFALENRRKTQSYLPKPICRVMKVQEEMPRGLLPCRETKKAVCRRGFLRGAGEAGARASRRAAAGSEDRQMKEGSEPRPGAGRKWEEETRILGNITGAGGEMKGERVQQTHRRLNLAQHKLGWYSTPAATSSKSSICRAVK